MEKGIKLEYDSNAVKGVAELSEAQINSFNFGNSARLRNDLVYYIPKQKLHAEDVTIRDVKMTSNKVFAFGCTYDEATNSLTPVTVTTLSINGLRQRHYGLVDKGPVTAEAEERDGVWRMKQGLSLPQTSVFVKGGVSVTFEGKTGIVAPCYFTVANRICAHTIGMTHRGDGKYDFNHEEKDGKNYIKFQATNLNEYQEELGMPSLGKMSDIDAKFKPFEV